MYRISPPLKGLRCVSLYWIIWFNQRKFSIRGVFGVHKKNVFRKIKQIRTKKREKWRKGKRYNNNLLLVINSKKHREFCSICLVKRLNIKIYLTNCTSNSNFSEPQQRQIYFSLQTDLESAILYQFSIHIWDVFKTISICQIWLKFDLIWSKK